MTQPADSKTISSEDTQPLASTDRDTVLPYQAQTPLATVRSVNFERKGNELTITVRPASISPRIVFRSFLFFACSVPAAAIAWSLCLELGRCISLGSLIVGGGMDPAAVFVGLIAAALLLWGAVASIRRLIYIARKGRLPSVIRVSHERIEIDAQGTTRSLTLSLPSNQIAHLEIQPGISGRRLTLQIVTTEDWLHLIPIPWPRGYPMIELEDNLRDVLGLSADVRR